MLRPSFHLYDLKLRQNWAIASRMGREGLGIRRRALLLLKLVDRRSGAVAYGEAAPVATYGETALEVLKDWGQLDWEGMSFDDLEGSLRILQAEASCQAARNAVEMALFDGASKVQGRSVANLLGFDDDAAIPATSFSIGISKTDELMNAARESRGFGEIKLKAGRTGLEETLAAFRSVRPEAGLRIDANEAWQSKEEALCHIETAARYGPVSFIEQPMPRNTPVEDLVWLKERSPLPLIADESYTGLPALEYCGKGFHGINVKLVKCGGLTTAAQSLKVARSAGMQTLLGCMIESSLGISAALQVSSLADWIDLDGALLTSNDPFEGLSEKSGKFEYASALAGNGMGVRPKQDFWSPLRPNLREIPRRGIVEFPSEVFGRSVNGLPLEVYLPSSGVCEVLVFASIHGEESETTALLSKALRSLDRQPVRTACVLCANPDGNLLGTRCNANGVELNRNFPASNWRAGTVSTKWSPEHGRVEFSTGSSPGSEPETKALIGLVESLRPRTVVALHAPLACIDDPEYSELGYRLARKAKLPLVGQIGYDTPGSFGSWAKEKGYHVITYELPPISVSAMHGEHLENMLDLLRFGCGSEARSELTG